MKALIVATVCGFISSFEIKDIKILQELGYKVYCAANFNEDNHKLDELNIIKYHVSFERSPLKRNNIRAFNELKKIMEKERFDLVHCHTPVGGVLGRLAAHKTNTSPVIYTAHGFHFYDGAPRKNWLVFYPIEKFFSRWTDILITINKEDYKRAKYNFYAKKIVYIPGVGVDTKRFNSCTISKEDKRKELGIPQEAFVLLSVGELGNRKNHQVVIDALGKLKLMDKIENIYYLIAGKGNLMEKYRLSADKYGISDRLILLGPRDDVDELCRMADVFVHPSIREGLGIAPLEGMAAGLPLISTYVNGIKDYTEDGVTGVCLVNPLDVDAMKNAIVRMQNDVEFRQTCSNKNIEIASIFSIEHSKEVMAKIYKRI